MKEKEYFMKEIKVFLASSEELKYDRLAFSDLIRKLDNIYEKRGIRIKLFQWEDFDAAYNDKRNALQEEFEHYRKQILRIERQNIELQGQEINEAVKRAMEAFAEGEVNKADIILSEATQGVAQRREEYIEHKKTGEQMRKNLLADINALLLKAETVLSNTEKDIAKRISEALNAYKEADKTAQEIDCPAEKYIELLLKYGVFLNDYAYYEESIEVNLRFIKLSEQTNGQNETTAMSYNNIGAIYDDLGDYDKALEFHNKALEIRKDVLEENHPDTAASYNNIGIVYDELGDYDKALEYHNKALEIFEEVLGESHPYTQQTLQNIAIAKQKLEESQGKTEEPKKKKGFWSKLFGKGLMY